jgi:hypothetical protein
MTKQNIRILINADKLGLIKALDALQNAGVDVQGVKVAGGLEKAKRKADRPYKLANAFDDNY